MTKTPKILPLLIALVVTAATAWTVGALWVHRDVPMEPARQVQQAPAEVMPVKSSSARTTSDESITSDSEGDSHGLKLPAVSFTGLSGPMTARVEKAASHKGDPAKHADVVPMLKLQPATRMMVARPSGQR